MRFKSPSLSVLHDGVIGQMYYSQPNDFVFWINFCDFACKTTDIYFDAKTRSIAVTIHKATPRNSNLKETTVIYFNAENYNDVINDRIFLVTNDLHELNDQTQLCFIDNTFFSEQMLKNIKTKSVKNKLLDLQI